MNQQSAACPNKIRIKQLLNIDNKKNLCVRIKSHSLYGQFWFVSSKKDNVQVST